MRGQSLFLIVLTWASIAYAGSPPGLQLVQNESLGAVSAFEKLGQEIQEELHFLNVNADKCTNKTIIGIGNTLEILRREIGTLSGLVKQAQTFVVCRYNGDPDCGEFKRVEAELRTKVDIEMTKNYERMRKAFVVDEKYPKCTADMEPKFQAVYKKVLTFKQDFYVAAKVPTKNGTEGYRLRSAPQQKLAVSQRTHQTSN